MSVVLADNALALRDVRRALWDAIQAGTTIGFDVETHGPYIQHPKDRKRRKPDALRHRTVGYGISIGSRAWYVPVRDCGSALWDARLRAETRSDALQALRFLGQPTARVVCHNWAFELQVLRNEGIEPKCVKLDSMLAAWMRGMRLPGKGGLKLKPLMESYFNRRRPDFEAVMRGRAVPDVPPEEVAPYCGADCLDAVALWERCWSEMSEEERRDYSDVEAPTIDVTTHMQAVGVPIDRALLAQASSDAVARMADLKERFRALTETTVMMPTKVKRTKRCPAHVATACPEPGCVGGLAYFKNGNPKTETVIEPRPVRAGADIASSAQVSRWLFDELKWWPKRGHRLTKSGELSTKADHIKPLIALENRDGAHAAALRLEYQGLSKYADLYTTGLINLADQSADGRLHTSYLQTGTDTGRFSSAFPNISNIPRDGNKVGMPAVRSAFVAPDGWVCVVRDMSQAELRMLAHFSRDPKLLEVYRNDGDVHAVTMANVGIERVEAKVTNFSCIYNITAPALAVKLTFFTGTRWTTERAQELIDGFFVTYGLVGRYHERAVAVARERGYARSIGGFRMPLTEWEGRSMYHTRNCAINYPIQGSVATILKRALVTLYRKWEAEGVLGERAVIQGQTYDSINVLARADFAEQANEDMRHIMESAAPELVVPLRTDGGIGTSWASAK